jgi:hypothetical protein
MIVSYTVAGWSTPDGGVAGTTVGGNTTRSFPNHPVVLQNRLPAGSNSVDIKTAIRIHGLWVHQASEYHRL